MEAEERRLELVGWLRAFLTRESGREVTHSLDTAQLPDPPRIEGEQPDLLARAEGNKLIIGLAKDGSDLSDEQTLKQYRAFGHYQDPESGERAALDLAVPAKFKAEAVAALEGAGLTAEEFYVLGVRGPNP